MKYLLHLVVSIVLVSIVSASRKKHYNVLYTTTTFSDNTHRFPRNYGQLAAFSNTSTTYFRGKLYEPSSSSKLFSCSQDSNVTTTRTPDRPFMVFLPMSDCPYDQARIAEEIGAIGIVFHSSDSRSGYLEAYHSPLKVVVSMVTLTDHELNSLRGILDFSNTYISVSVKQTSTISTSSNTFYFVVFAFSVLVMLSLTWFMITYVRRCCDHYSIRRRRTLAHRRTLQTIKKLPTKKYKIVKTSDSESISSLDEPTCVVCLDPFKNNDCLRELPCQHEFHQECIDPWLKSKGTCPLCKLDIIGSGQRNTTSVSRVIDLEANNDDNQQPNEQEMNSILEEIEESDESTDVPDAVLVVNSETTST